MSVGWLESFVPGPVVLRTSAYTVPACNGQVVVVGSLGAACTITLPEAPITGQIVIVKRAGAEDEMLTVSGNGKLIDGGATYAVSGDSGCVWLCYSGSAWCVLSTYVAMRA